MHSIELLLDASTDGAVRQQWSLLAEAGLPSQARHTGDSNAPHVTLVARGSIDPAHDGALRERAGDLPLPFRFGGLVVFGTPPRGLVLARLVVVTDRILRLHDDVHEAVRAGSAETSIEPADLPHTRPGTWTPHVTLASRLTTAQLASAVEVLGRAPTAEIDATFTTLRRWDSDLREVVALDPVPTRRPSGTLS